MGGMRIADAKLNFDRRTSDKEVRPRRILDLSHSKDSQSFDDQHPHG
jgi:hypothetical protein